MANPRGRTTKTGMNGPILVPLSRGRTTICKKPVCVVPKMIAPGRKMFKE